jgi:hypothetical protein
VEFSAHDLMFFFSTSSFFSLIMHFPADIVEHLLKSVFTLGFHAVCLVLICKMSAFLPTLVKVRRSCPLFAYCHYVDPKSRARVVTCR